MLEYILLGFLMYGDMSGYDMKQFMAHSTAYFYNASFGSIYPTLRKLEEEKCVTLLEKVEDGKFKKLYSVTEDGRSRFLAWLARPIEFDRSGYSHLIRIFFYGWLEPAKARELVGAYIWRMEEELAELRRHHEFLEGNASFCQMSTLEFGIEYYDFTIAWCRRFNEKSTRLEQAGDLKKEGKCK